MKQHGLQLGGRGGGGKAHVASGGAESCARRQCQAAVGRMGWEVNEISDEVLCTVPGAEQAFLKVFIFLTSVCDCV